ncbi:sigma-70 family RNA polymerase sigma factor [Nocardiopsis sp. N85]|uniref:sigma-70 family RNA polymerase sigma factor n=1 Tax=Nocardiopsis sp. N85 TaxID=3029400 RepID=UPI00237EFF46|nr:sigma-70 family RNA polymerase sigma factor [Nocardiopsis sp. N85]MDE3721993.1 sigma-70 family RNA polymerase sigma factor [Nocardiopsis sp. N85]
MTPIPEPHRANATLEVDPRGAPESGAEFIRAVCELHGAVLLRYALSLVDRDVHRAEDLVQEAVLRAWRNRMTLNTAPEGLRPWLFTVVRRLVIDAHRARSVRPAEVPPDDAHERPVADATERIVTAQVVADALRDLSPMHREILVHVHYLGRGVNETAELLGIPPGTVKSRTHKAVRALKERLSARGYRR